MQADRKKHEEEQLLKAPPIHAEQYCLTSEDLVKEAKRRAQASFR